MNKLLIAVALFLSVLSVSGQYTAAQLKSNDAIVLNFALTLEHLELAFYTKFQGVFNQQNFTAAGYPASTYQYFSLIMQHETAHVAALTAAVSSLGFTPVSACPSYEFGTITTVAQYIGLAQTFEATGVAAYDGAVNNITDKGYTQTAATIATVEARHAAYLNTLTGASPFPNSLDTANTTQQIGSIVAQFLGANCNVVFPSVLVQLPVFSSLTFPNGTFIQNATGLDNVLSQNDIYTLEYALFLENLESAFYTKLFGLYSAGNFSAAGYNASVYNNVNLIRLHEAAHVAYLESIVATPAACTYNFTASGPLNTLNQWLALAATFESVGTSAYDGAINTITNKAYVEAAATIATVEGRHSAYLNLITGLNNGPFPNITEPVLTPAMVASIVSIYVSGCTAPILPMVLTLSPNNGTAPATSTTSTASSSTGTSSSTGGSSATGTATSTSTSTSTSTRASAGAGSTTSSGSVVYVSAIVLLLVSIVALLM